MAKLHLVTGYAGAEHVTATDQAALNAAMIGTGQFVFDKGNVFKAQVVTNNQIRVLDGELMMQGRFVRLNPDTYVELTIESGTQGKLRNDLIAVRYTKNTSTGVEDVNLVVIKGTAVNSNPVDPAVTEADITNGEATLHEFPLWRIPINGLNVNTPVPLFGEPFMDSMRTLPVIRAAVASHEAEVAEHLQAQDEAIDDLSAQCEATNANVSNRAIIASGSYVGTGTNGVNNPNSLTFDFVPKMVFMTAAMYPVTGGYYSLSPLFGYSDPEYYHHVMCADALSTEYSSSVGFGDAAWPDYHGRKSEDGKTFYWYVETNAAAQLNAAGTTYYYVAIG